MGLSAPQAQGLAAPGAAAPATMRAVVGSAVGVSFVVVACAMWLRHSIVKDVKSIVEEYSLQVNQHFQEVLTYLQEIATEEQKLVVLVQLIRGRLSRAPLGPMGGLLPGGAARPWARQTGRRQLPQSRHSERRQDETSCKLETTAWVVVEHSGGRVPCEDHVRQSGLVWFGPVLGVVAVGEWYLSLQLPVRLRHSNTGQDETGLAGLQKGLCGRAKQWIQDSSEVLVSGLSQEDEVPEWFPQLQQACGVRGMGQSSRFLGRCATPYLWALKFRSCLSFTCSRTDGDLLRSCTSSLFFSRRLTRTCMWCRSSSGA